MGANLNSKGLTFKSGSTAIGGWEIDPDDGESIQFRVPKEKLGTTHDKIGFYISASGKIGIGTKDPESAFDVRDISEDVDPKDKTTGTKILNIDANEQRFDIPISASLITASAVRATKFIGTTFEGILLGNASTSTTLETARTIGGVSFDGSANINLPGVNTSQTNNKFTWAGTAATATTASFAITSSITTGTAATASFVTGSAVAGDIKGNAKTATSATLATTASVITAGKSTLTFTVNKSTLTITDGAITWSLLGGS